MEKLSEKSRSIGWIECYYLCNKTLTDSMAERYILLCEELETEPDQNIMDYINLNIFPEIDF